MFASVLVYFYKYHGQCLSQSWFTFINIMVNVCLEVLVYFYKYHGQCLSQSWFTFINIMVNVCLSLGLLL